MSRFVLRPTQGTCTFHKITEGRFWVGRVYPKASGGFGAKLGKHTADGATAIAAFEQVVALHEGFANVRELIGHNAEVREKNRANRQAAQHAVHEFFRGNADPLFRVLDK